jgi:hypothetical protein
MLRSPDFSVFDAGCILVKVLEGQLFQLKVSGAMGVVGDDVLSF